MKPLSAALLSSALALSTVSGLLAADTLRLEPVWAACKTERPISLVQSPDGSGRQFLVQQKGKILILPKDPAGSETKTFLDLSDRKMEENDFEEGLLGLAFHPKYKENGRVFVYYSQQDPKHSVISEFKVSKDDPDKLDPSTERILLTVPQPFWNHNSGNTLFGPDGFLYISFGDGGKGGDPLRFGQNRFMLLGKIIRIDVDSRTGSRGYGIPKDNPFLNREAMQPEIYAWGLRNPWGLSFDKETGLFWCADVGQDIWEEINIVEKGGNYGWSWREGKHPFNQRQEAPPEEAKFIDPIHEYSHAEGISVTGGFVYHGKEAPAIKGAYIFGDFGNGRIWSLRYDPATKTVSDHQLLIDAKLDAKGEAAFKPTAFCEDANGEAIMLDWRGGLYRMLPQQP
ncbi:MAG: glucose sorbosone dehydrogenase [Verrucomicrobiaceae bacterium]|nr:MAG: glucose sorbosone dehydrogenase [Verrucomicrobiaceae bacterium]